MPEHERVPVLQANALTSATTVAGNTRGRPERRRSASPAIPSAQYRDRHLRTVSTLTQSRRAITAFAVPTLAASTILARTTARTEAVREFATRVSACHSLVPRVTWKGEEITMSLLSAARQPRRR